MRRYILNRCLYSFVVLFVASAVVFFGLRVAPGAPEGALLSPTAAQEARDELRRELGLDDPIPLQYLNFLKELVTLDLGESLKSGQSVTEVLKDRGLNSLVLVSAAGVVIYAIGIPLGIIAATRRDRFADHALMGFASVSMGIPGFLIALILIQVVGSRLGWLPISGTGGLEHLVLPVIALSLEGVAITLRLMRSTMLDELSQDYVRALRAKGLRHRATVWKRASKNAVVPLISLAGVQLGALVGYTAVVEVIFRWPGLGSLLTTAVLSRDYPVALWTSMLLTATVVFLNFAANVGYAVVDPRIRLGGNDR